MNKFIKTLAAAGLALGLLQAAAVRADDFPSRPLRYINPNPPGSGSDVVGRTFASALAKQLNQAVYVENRGGAGSTIGSELGAKAAADGYTLTQTSSPLFSVVPLVYPKLAFDPVKDFRSIIMLAGFQNVLVVHPSVPVKSVSELIAYARAHPGKLTYASTGNGTTTHLSGEMFRQMTGADITHVPYKGGAPATNDLLGGQVNMMFANVPAVIQHIKAGSLRALAATGATREPGLPEVPTMAEAGVANYEAAGWFSVSVPAATPQPVVDKLSKAAMAAVKQPEFMRVMEQNGFSVMGGTPQQMDQMAQAEIRRWGPVVKATNLRLD